MGIFSDFKPQINWAALQNTIPQKEYELLRKQFEFQIKEGERSTGRYITNLILTGLIIVITGFGTFFSLQANQQNKLIQGLQHQSNEQIELINSQQKQIEDLRQQLNQINIVQNSSGQ